METFGPIRTQATAGGYKKTYDFGLVFWVVAFLLAVLVFDMVWWHAAIIILVSSINFNITTTHRYRRF